MGDSRALVFSSFSSCAPSVPFIHILGPHPDDKQEKINTVSDHSVVLFVICGVRARRRIVDNALLCEE